LQDPAWIESNLFCIDTRSDFKDRLLCIETQSDRETTAEVDVFYIKIRSIVATLHSFHSKDSSYHVIGMEEDNTRTSPSV